MSDVPAEVTPAAPVEVEPAPLKLDGLELKAERDPERGRWVLFTEVGGVRWEITERKLGGLDDDLQEIATPGFKEARAQRYAAEFGRPRAEPGPGA